MSFWSLRRWRREYAKATAAGESTGGTPAPTAPAQETKSMNAAMIDNDKALAETISHIESEIAHVDQELAVLNQNREALNRVLVMFKERAGSRETGKNRGLRRLRIASLFHSWIPTR